jgi:hypothetical protein
LLATEEIAEIFARAIKRLKDGVSMTVNSMIAEDDLFALAGADHPAVTAGTTR